MTTLPDHDYTACADDCPRCTSRPPRDEAERAEMLLGHEMTACPTPGCIEDSVRGELCIACRAADPPDACDCESLDRWHCNPPTAPTVVD